MPDRDPSAFSSSNEVAGEDFLFHLYRGSELLQDNRVHDAKAELEQALRFQPSDPKGQDLLGIVYFRLGLYPRAIAIYEKLVHSHPEAIEPRVNLALSYLKTGQAQAARFELERVVEQNPNHSRAWGYLGLSFQRLGDFERASHAFAAGGHDVMARRLLDMAIHASPNTTVTSPASLLPGAAEGREVGGPAVSEGHDVSAPISLRLGAPRIPSDSWTAIDADVAPKSVPPPAAEPTPMLGAAEHGAAMIDATPNAARAAASVPAVIAPSLSAPLGLAPSLSASAPPGFSAVMPAAPPVPRIVETPLPSERPRVLAPMPVAQALREALLVYPRALPIAQHVAGVVLVQTASGFATRLDLTRSLSLSGPLGDALPRRVRGRVTDEPLGGTASPLLEVPGKGELLLAPGRDQQLLALTMADDPLYLREESVAGLDISVAYENGRLPVGDGDAIPMVQFRGIGTVVACVPSVCYAVEVLEGRTLMVRAAHVVAWFGRLLPRALLVSEAPGQTRGLVAFTGEGMVLLDGRP